MATKHVLKAEPRNRTGSGHLKQMRREGWIPSVIYGRGAENKNLKINARAFQELLNHSSSENILVDLDVEGEGNRLAFLQAIQHDPLNGEALHADFLAVDEKTEIVAHVPLHLTGEAAGVKAGGQLDQLVHVLEVRCLANSLVEELSADVTHLEEGAALHIGDLKLPAGITATHGAEVVIAHVVKSVATADA